MDFQPKQITQYNAAHMNELQDDVSEQAIKYCLSFTPPFSDGDVIHDNASGPGAVTSTIMESLPHGTSIHIEATDVNEQFVAGCKALAESNKWPVTTSVMSAQKLTFPDDHFTQSFTSFAFHCLGDHDTASKQIHRTLKAGGVCVACIWTYMPHVNALQHAHWRTRGKDAPMPILLPVESFQEKDLRGALEVGGFKDIECHEKDCFLRIRDLKQWCQLAWSYLGKQPTGWTQNDEDRWKEAVDDAVEQMESADGVTKNEKGEHMMKMVACIAVAKK